MFIGDEPIHIKCENRSDIAPVMLMPGDPLRAKYIATNFLTDAKLVTSVRNMLGYTGYYKGKKVSVMGSGMGMPSMGIYAWELFHYFNVEKIIRIGTCGVVDPSVKVPEIILADNLYTNSKFGVLYNGYDSDQVKPSLSLNETILKTAEEQGIVLHEGTIMTTDVFGPYIDVEAMMNAVPKDVKPIGEEMEGFALALIAKDFNKEATVMATAVDSMYSKTVLSIEDREKSLNEMITLALDSIIK